MNHPFFHFCPNISDAIEHAAGKDEQLIVPSDVPDDAGNHTNLVVVLVLKEIA